MENTNNALPIDVNNVNFGAIALLYQSLDMIEDRYPGTAQTNGFIRIKDLEQFMINAESAMNATKPDGLEITLINDKDVHE